MAKEDDVKMDKGFFDRFVLVVCAVMAVFVWVIAYASGFGMTNLQIALAMTSILAVNVAKKDKKE